MSIQLEIVSPEKIVASHEVDMAVIPALEGDIAAMEGHEPMILLLRGGVVDLYEGNKKTKSFFVEGGFAEIKETGCTVLANDIKLLDELSADMGRQLLADSKESYKEAAKGNNTEKQRALVEEMVDAQFIIDIATARSKK